MAYIGKSPSTGIRNRFIYTATAGQTTFSGTDDHNRTLSYTDAEFTDVFLNGVKLDKSDYTATSGTSIVLDEAAAASDTLEVLNFDTFSVFSGEFSQDVTVGGATTLSGDLTVDTNTLKVDSTNNRVGVANASPSTALDVTGTVTANRAAIYSGVLSEQSQIRFGYSSDYHWSIGRENATTGDLFFESSTSGTDTTRMVITNSGNVGIGTDSPATLLELKDTTPTIRLNDERSITWSGGEEMGAIEFFSNDGSGIHPSVVSFIKTIQTGSSTSVQTDLTFGTNAYNSAATERMRIDSSGNLLVGTTGIPNGTSVYGFGVIDGGGSNLKQIRTASSTTTSVSVARFYNPNGNVGSIQTSGSSTSYVTSSDYRLKENVTGITDGIERVKQLNPSRFNFIADADTTVDGFLAHEAATVVPEAVTGEKDAVDEEGNPEYQGIDQSKLVPLLTAALQEAITKIETLETQNADFETRIAALEANNE